jgi:hypothetical protein
MERTVVLGIAAMLLCAGCKTQPTAYILPVRTAPNTSMDGYAKSSADKTHQPFYDRTGTIASVRSGEVVKAYGVNRYVDPADPRVMHERHAIYRVEEGPGWVMQTPQGKQGILLGPVVGLKKPEDAPAPRESEVKRELLAARQALDKNNDQLSQIRQNQEGMGEFLKNSAEAQAKLAAITDRLNQRLQKVETKMGQDSSAPEMDQERDERTVPQKSTGSIQP